MNSDDRIQQELVQSQQNYIDLANNLNSGLVIYKAIDDGGDFVFVDFNRAAERIEKLNRDEVIGKSVLKIFPRVKEFGLFEVLQRVWRTGKSEHHPVTLYKDDRVSGWRENYVYKLLGGEIVAIYDDVTELKKVNEELIFSETRYRRLFETAKDGILILDGDTGLIIDVNPFLIGLLGLSKERFLGKELWELGFFKDIVASKTNFDELQTKGYVRYEDLPLKTVDGRQIAVEFVSNIYEVDHRKVIQCNIRDITERKRLEEKTRYLATFPEKNPNPILELDNEGNLRYLNPVTSIIFPDLITTGINHPFLAGWAQVVRELQGSNWTRPINREIKVGSMYFLQTIHPVSKSQIRVYARDISDNKRVEKALTESEERYRTLFEKAAEGIVIADIETKKFKYANSAICKMLGYSQEELTTMGVANIHPKASLDYVFTEFDAQARGEKLLSTLPCLKKDGTIFYVDINSGKASIDGRECNIGFFTDVTDRKHMEEEHLRTAKLESIGTLAGGIAHDFNNILTGILGNIQLVDGYLKQNRTDTAKEMLAEAERASLRAKDLTQQLLTFSRGGAPVKKVMFINHLIRDSATFALRGSKVKPEFTIPDNLWAVDADEGQLNQVISNLVVNADQAMPNGGVINVSTRNVDIKKQPALPLNEGSYVEIVLEDHGTGIPADHKSRIFEPYFTTKHKGSGLGLATSFSIIKNHGGTITFESELGVGTTFHVYLPATKEKVKKEERKSPAATEPLPSTQGRILVMDDEETIRRLLGRMLTGAGYEVELTRDGDEAVRKYTEAKESGKPFDAVILDLTVPGGMGGKEVIAKLLGIDPGVKAIVSSGYATDPIMAEFKKYGFSGVVIKPYNLRQMQDTLHDVLAEK